ncbi:MAG: DNA alkylation repair protein [Gemmatimonadota bacterium]
MPPSRTIQTASAAQRALQPLGDPERAQHSARYFKTGPGEYAEGDQFRGIRVPELRRVARAARGMALGETLKLLRSKWHEDRLVALIILVAMYQRAQPKERERIVAAYMRNTRYIDNWDLVDSSASYILGPHLENRSRATLYKLARSNNIWERRIAIITTAHFHRAGNAADTLAIAELLLDDDHDLIHKAVGWMLREVGDRCGRNTLTRFLDSHVSRMPRTMLRYAIEHFDPAGRTRYLAVKRTA